MNGLGGLMRILLMMFAILGCGSVISWAGDTDLVGQTLNKARFEAKRLAVIGEIRARLVDRKDIKERYVRVRFDGKTLQLAAFVQSTNVAAEIETIARGVAKPEKLETYWSVIDGLRDRDPYKTYVGEQASDAGIWIKVKASLANTDVRPSLTNVHVQAVDVDHGNVTVYLIEDAPTEGIDLSPHIKNIDGVTNYQSRELKAFAPAVP